MKRGSLAFILPTLVVLLAFFVLPIIRLLPASVSADEGLMLYAEIITNPRYASSMISTIVLSVVVTAASVLLGTFTGLFLEKNDFPGRNAVVSLMTLPLSFPGVVVGFMIIMLGGRNGLLGMATQSAGLGKLVFAYGMAGLFAGYVYFSIPRVVTTVMAAAKKINPMYEEAARTLGAGSWRILLDVTLPALTPALVSTGAICFATSMGAFGTAFTLATDINVLPITIYTEFTLSANIAAASMLSVVLGAITWVMLLIARRWSAGDV